MPKLKNARHERFAQGLTAGKTADQAYVDAGFKRNDGNAARLKGNDRIKARVEELQHKAAERAVTTVEDIARQLDDDRGVARKNKQGSAMVSATMGKAKVLGLIVDKHLVGVKRVEDMNEHELRALLGVVGKPDGGGS